MSSSTAGRIPRLSILGNASAAELTTEAGGTHSDEQLLNRSASGDQGAFTVVFSRFSRIVRSIAIRIIRDAAEAEDLLQETFLYIYRNCASFDSSKGTARAWIIQIAQHRALDRLRHLQSRRFYSNEAIDETVASVADPRTSNAAYDFSLEGVLGREEARRLFESLSEDQRETIRLVFYEGYTFEEIAGMKGQSFGNVRNHYYRGLEKLRRQIFATNLRGC